MKSAATTAYDPQDLKRLLVSRQRARDLDGMMTLSAASIPPFSQPLGSSNSGVSSQRMSAQILRLHPRAQ